MFYLEKAVSVLSYECISSSKDEDITSPFVKCLKSVNLRDFPRAMIWLVNYSR